MISWLNNSYLLKTNVRLTHGYRNTVFALVSLQGKDKKFISIKACGLAQRQKHQLDSDICVAEITS